MLALFQSMRCHPSRIALTIGIVALLTWGTFAVRRQAWARRHFQETQRALDQGDLDLAQRHVERCLEVWDDRAAVQLLAAQTARRREAYDEADRRLSQCERLGGTTEATALERKLLIAQQGQPEDVLDELKDMAEEQPSHGVAIWEALSRGYLNSACRSDALKCAEMLRRIAPERAEGALCRGRVLETLSRDPEALRDYQRAVELAPASDEARLRLGATLYRLGRPLEALPHYKCLEQRQPSNADVLLGLARCSYELHALDEARRFSDRLLTEHPDHVPALLDRGRLELHAGRPAEAERWLRHAADGAPCDRDVHISLRQCLEAEGKNSDARACQERLQHIEADQAVIAFLVEKARHLPRDAAVRCEIGGRLLAQGRADDAVSWFFAALGEDANYGPAHMALAAYFDRAGQHYRAERQRRAVLVPPKE
jgi:tetratricopeptide (TPR) repeat protein